MAILACFSIKGGVGKTTTAVNLAHAAASQGYRTLLWDLDSQGAASFYLNARPGAQFELSLANDVKQLAKYVVPSGYENLAVIPNKFSNRRLEDVLSQGTESKQRLKAMLFPLLKDYDLIVLDCPPGVSSLTDNALTAADATVVPTIPAPLSVRTLRQLRKHVKSEGIETDLLPFFCMQDCRRSAHRNIVEYHQQVEADEVLSAVIPYSAIVERMGVKKRPLASFASVSAPTAAYKALFAEVEERLSISAPKAASSVVDDFKADLLAANAELLAEATAASVAEKVPAAEVAYMPPKTRAFSSYRTVQPVRFANPG